MTPATEPPRGHDMKDEVSSGVEHLDEPEEPVDPVDPVEAPGLDRPARWYELGRSPNVIIRQAYRLIVLVVGVTIVAGGIAMFVLPGPGILVVIAGLAVLATEFMWARLLLQRARGYAKKAKEKTMGKGGLGSLKRRLSRKPQDDTSR